MESKLSELSKPCAEVVSKFGDPEAFGERELKVLANIQKLAYGTKFYSQEYVSALLAELENKDRHLKASIRRESAARKGFDEQYQRAEVAEAKLATPIKIVNYDEFFICHVTGASDDYCSTLR